MRAPQWLPNGGSGVGAAPFVPRFSTKHRIKNKAQFTASFLISRKRSTGILKTSLVCLAMRAIPISKGQVQCSRVNG